jgi:hypothetical protein
VLHGEDDSIIPVQEGREFVEALAQKSDNPVVYAEIPHAQHAFDFFGSPHGHYTATAVAHFLDWVGQRGWIGLRSPLRGHCASTTASSESPAARRISMNA